MSADHRDIDLRVAGATLGGYNWLGRPGPVDGLDYLGSNPLLTSGLNYFAGDADGHGHHGHRGGYLYSRGQYGQRRVYGYDVNDGPTTAAGSLYTSQDATLVAPADKLYARDGLAGYRSFGHGHGYGRNYGYAPQRLRPIAASYAAGNVRTTGPLANVQSRRRTDASGNDWHSLDYYGYDGTVETDGIVVGHKEEEKKEEAPEYTPWASRYG